MTKTPTPASHAVNTAPISADLRWIEQDARELPEPSPTAGMSLGQRIMHVGGRENAAGYIEFGSVAAVRALVAQVLRDLPARTTPTQCLHQIAEPAEYPFLPQSVGTAVDFMDGRPVDIDWSHPAPNGGTDLYTAAQMRAYVDADRALRAAPPAVPVLYVSPAQLEKHLDLEGAENAEAGRYLPARKTPAGKFTQPLYALAPAPAQEHATQLAGQGEATAAQLEAAWREGWAKCRDAEYVGQEAEDWAFGQSQTNSIAIDATQLAGQGPDLREHLRWALQRIRRLDHEASDASCGAKFSGAVAALERADAVFAWSPAAAPIQAQEDARDTERLDWLTFNLSGAALRAIGVVWSEHADARRAIDAARAAQGGA